MPGGAAEVADIDETVVPDGKLATRVHRAGERNEIARGSLPKVQQAHHTDESKGLEDPQNVPHRVRTTNIGHNNGVEVGGDVAGTRHDIEVKNSLGNHLNVLSGHSSLPSIGINANAAARGPETVRTARKKNRNTHIVQGQDNV